MLTRILIFLLGACATLAAETDRIKLDARVLTDLPAKRRAALTRFAFTDRDSTPAISEKRAKYTEILKTLLLDLRKPYYWHAEFPKDADESLATRAVLLAGLHYPASPTTGASYYGDLVQSYTILLYEEEIVIIARAVTERFSHPDITVVQGQAQSFERWKKAWDDAGKIAGAPNQRTEP